MCLVLEVGKTYLNGYDREVKIVSDEGASSKPMIGVSLRNRAVHCYRRDGCAFQTYDGYDPRDLIRTAPTPHPHAESMMLYAKDAAECEQPWLRWEKRDAKDKEFRRCSMSPTWVLRMDYRRKPRSEWPHEAC